MILQSLRESVSPASVLGLGLMQFADQATPLGSTAGLSLLSRLLCAAVKGGDPRAALIVDFVIGLWFGRGGCWTKIGFVCSLKVVLLSVLASL